MKTKELFIKDIFRHINGVVKADQMDDRSVWQELDEFVVTKELGHHMDRFFDVYSDSIDHQGDPDVSGKIGVWVSGFFGSGKSHFIKALSYLLSKKQVELSGQSKNAVEFFEEKIEDAMLFGNIKRSVSKDTDVILFNIDSKADQSKGRDAILAVFLKVLNELQGFSPDHPHIAHMERYLTKKGLLKDFHNHYQELTGTPWREERDSYMFNQDEIVKALSQTLEQSEEACHRWIDNAEGEFELTVENFAKWVKDYLNEKGSDHRIIFFVDEIGQFIGQDVHLMLNLQTIVENLGVVCEGRAWVVVTSQEDIDTVLGSLSNARSNDFSKIQGRFKTRLSLSSANADEVIQARLLKKKPEVTDQLSDVYSQNADILKNQLTFSKAGMTLSSFKNTDDFVKNYPFIPYQFKLLQKVFETIRRAGATGLHLSRGERSMLDAFQYAGKIAASKDMGILVPLYWFYPSIESFLDTAVKCTIDQAEENQSLHEFDIQILRTLFMIRYIEEVKGSVDNLVTLCIDRIDADRFELREKIEKALGRLEKETLISRSGEDYFFLTNEERDISREIKNVELEFGSESRELGTIIFEDILKGNKKHRHQKTNADFNLNRFCDLYAVGGKIEEGLMVSVITPFYDDYNLYDKTKCIMQSTEENGHIIIKLPEKPKLQEELWTYLKTEKYIARKNMANTEVERILRDRKDENRQRKARLVEMTKEMLEQADIYVAGQPLNIDSSDPVSILSKTLEYLIDNTFSKMSFIEHPTNNPQAEVQSVLRANDIGQQTLNLTLPEHNPKAVREVRQYVDLCTKTSKQIVMHDLVTKKFHFRPYGWSEWETVLILARLIVAGEIQLIMNGAIIENKRICELISKTSNWRKITIKLRKTVDSALLQQTRKLGQELFGTMGPDNEDGLFAFFKEKLSDWQNKLKEYKPLADTGNYPGKDEIDTGLRHISVLINDKESYRFINRLIELKDDLLDFAEDFHDIDNFYKTQKPVWKNLSNEYTKFNLNKFELEKDPDASKALKEMEKILNSKAPYGIIQQADALIKKVSVVNNNLISAYRTIALNKIETLLDELDKELNKAKADAEFRESVFKPMLDLKNSIEKQDSIAHLMQADQRGDAIFQQQIRAISDYLKKKAEKEPDSAPVDKIKPVVTIKPGQLSAKTYLETKEDVKEFVARLENKLNEAVDKNQRIRID